jgi:hypothetical protein
MAIPDRHVLLVGLGEEQGLIVRDRAEDLSRFTARRVDDTSHLGVRVRRLVTRLTCVWPGRVRLGGALAGSGRVRVHEDEASDLLALGPQRDIPGSALSQQFRWRIRAPSRHRTAEARSV